MSAVVARPRYSRAEVAPAMRFQERDGEILNAIYKYGGLMAKRQIKEVFWPTASWRAMEMRLSLLYHQGYLDWPSLEAWRTKPIPEPTCWLGWKGALWVASRQGVRVEQMERPTEVYLRRTAQTLHREGLYWLREPRWSQLAHDLRIIDVWLAVEQAVRELPHLTLETWTAERELHSAMSVVEYTVQDVTGRPRRKRRGVIPDGYFCIVDERRRREGLPARARFLLEVDMGTVDAGRFVEEKVAAGLAYIQSQAYAARFGDNSGCWLIVSKGEVRLKHLRHEISHTIGNGIFLFSTLDQVATDNVLTAPIWWQVENTQVALFPGGGR